MGAFTGSPTQSTQRANERDAALKVDLRDSSGLRVKCAEYTHTAGAGTGEINLFTLPPGRIRIYPDLCRIITSAYASTAQIHLGHRAYVREDGVTEIEDDNEWRDNLVVTTAQDVTWDDGGTVNNVYNSRDGIIVYALVDVANIEDTDTLYVLCVYSGGEGN